MWPRAIFLAKVCVADAEIVQPLWRWADKESELGEELKQVRAIREPGALGVHAKIEAAARARKPPPPPPAASSGPTGIKQILPLKGAWE